MYLHGRYACICIFTIYLHSRTRVRISRRYPLASRYRRRWYKSGIKRRNKNHTPHDLSATPAAAAVRCFQQRRTLRLRNGRCSSVLLRNGKKLCNVPAKSLRPQLRRRTSRVSGRATRDYCGRNNTRSRHVQITLTFACLHIEVVWDLSLPVVLSCKQDPPAFPTRGVIKLEYINWK